LHLKTSPRKSRKERKERKNVLIQNIKEYNDLLVKVHQSPAIVYDLETNGLDSFHGNRLIGVAILIPDMTGETDGESFYVPFRHKVGTNIPIRELYKLAPFFADPDKTLIGFNLKFDVHFTEIEGMTVFNRFVDVMLGAHLNNENELTFQLKRLGDKYMSDDASQEQSELKALLKEKKLGMGDMNQLLPEQVGPYAEQDVILTWKLAKFFQHRLVIQKLADLWAEVNEYCKIISAMERRGVLINPELCQVNSNIAQVRCDDLMAVMVALVGHEFNPRSVPQLRKILGQHKTDKESLKTCKHALAPLLLEYRGWNRAITTYYNGFQASMDENCRIHPNLNVHGTISGRLSCTKPNLQALPKKKDTYKVRELVIAPPGFKLLSFDWSQAELRILAHYTQDPFLIKVFKDEKDIHQETADQLNLLRDLAKRINFGIVYGIGAVGLSEMANVSIADAKVYLEHYHKLIPGIRILMNFCEKMASRDRKMPMWTGRLRHYRSVDEVHKAMSNLIQGGVAEMMRVATTKLGALLEGTLVHMTLQVHDEILFEIPDAEVKYWIPKIKAIMEDFRFHVPIVVDCKVGTTWSNLQGVKFDLAGTPIIGEE